MLEIKAAISHTRALDLGPRKWDELCLERAHDKLSAWNMHRHTLEEFVEKSDRGPSVLCPAWVDLVQSESDIKDEFGGVLSKELLFHRQGVGKELANSLAVLFDGISKRALDAPLEVAAS